MKWRPLIYLLATNRLPKSRGDQRNRLRASISALQRVIELYPRRSVQHAFERSKYPPYPPSNPIDILDVHSLFWNEVRFLARSSNRQ